MRIEIDLIDFILLSGRVNAECHRQYATAESLSWVCYFYYSHMVMHIPLYLQ